MNSYATEVVLAVLGLFAAYRFHSSGETEQARDWFAFGVAWMLFVLASELVSGGVTFATLSGIGVVLLLYSGYVILGDLFEPTS